MKTIFSKIILKVLRKKEKYKALKEAIILHHSCYDKENILYSFFNLFTKII